MGKGKNILNCIKQYLFHYKNRYIKPKISIKMAECVLKYNLKNIL